MFASSMKILTLNTPNNASPTTAQNDSGTQPVNKVLNSISHDENGGSRGGSGLSHKTNKRDQKHNNKTKFAHGSNKMQQNITQQHLQTQKYHHKNSNGNKLKNQQHYPNNNGSNNNTSSANRKKYYQQPQHHQQHQHYVTAVQKSINCSPTNTPIANNNNSNLVKNQNYCNNDFLSQQNLLPHSDVVKNLVNNFSTNLAEVCTCLLQPNNCDTFPLNSFSSDCSRAAAASELTNKTVDLHTNNICYDNRLKSSSASNTQTSEVQKTNNSAPASSCISCWKNLKKLSQPATSTGFETNKTNEIANNCDANENLAKSKSSIAFLPTYSADNQSELPNTSTTSSVLRRKSLWKNSNTSVEIASAFGTVVNRNLTSGYSLGSNTLSPRLLKRKQHHVSDNSFTLNTGKNLDKNTKQNCNEEKYSAKLTANNGPSHQTRIIKHQVQAKEKIEMTTALASSSSSSSTSSKTSVSSNTNTLTSKTSNPTPKTQPGTLGTPNDTKQMLKAHTYDLNKISTSTSFSSTNTPSVVTSPQNSYTLDFLHSVGAKMTGVTVRSADTQGANKTYGHQAVTNSSVHSACPYTGMATHQRQPRYLYNGSNVNSNNNGNQLQHYHHHHQPSQLTIASFLHKDFLGGDKTPPPVGTNNSRGNSSTSSRNTNHYHDRQQQPHYSQQQQQQQTNTRYQHNYAAATYQQQTAVLHHTNYSTGGGYNGGGHRSSGYAYTNYQNGLGKSNSMAQLHSRQLKNNMANFKHTPSSSQTNKKTTYASSTTSNGSLSSSKSFSSNSSNISNRQLQTTVRNQDSNKDSSSQNLAIETLSSKMLNGGHQRGSHRGHHNNHRGHHQHLMMNSPNILQHQNYYNLTYVTTDSSANSAVSSRGCSPAPQSLPPTPLSATNCNSPKVFDQSPGHAAMLMNFNASQLQYPRYQHGQVLATQQHPQFRQFQQPQKTKVLNKKVIVPLSLTLSSQSSSPRQISNSNQAMSQNFVCCSQLDEVSTAAAAAAASSSSSLAIIAGSDYDSDNCSNHSSTQIRCQSINSSNSSTSSSSTSSTSIKAQQVQQKPSLQPATAVTYTQTTPLNSPLNYCAGGTTSQNFSNMQAGHQLTQFHGNNGGGSAVIPVLNLPAKDRNSFSDGGYLQQQQFVLSATASQISPDPFSIAVSNHFNNSSGYWSPSFRNNQFIYHQFSTTQTAHVPPPVTSSSSSCGSSTASLSPRLPNDDMLQQVNSKRGSPHLMVQQTHRSTTQLTPQSSSSSASSVSNTTVSTLCGAVHARSENGVHITNGCNSQLIVPSSTSAATLVESNTSGSQHLPATATSQQFYSHHHSLPPPPPPPQLPPHNLLYSNPQVHHIRALSSSSVNDFFAHTPPDRFLARAHLIEVKEAPASLLNNSKWDHLSQSIWKKFINSQQTEETFKQKMKLWRYLYVFIKNAYPRYGLYLVGSTISGFGSDSSDVDMCLVSRSASSIDPRLEALFNLNVLRDCLKKSGQFENFKLIGAKVPILRFSDRVHQFKVDLNFNNCVGIKNTHLLYCYSQLDWRLRPLVLVTKLWAQHHNINNAKDMTISSYSLVLMVIHFLQYAVNPPVLPCLHDILPDKFPLLRSNDFGYVDMNETIGPYESKNTQTLGELLLMFLEYYSFFDYAQFAISVRTGGLIPVSMCRVAKSLKNDPHQWKELCIEEPFDLTNTARSVYDFQTFERVKAVFIASWRILQETLDLNSLFSTVLLPSPNAIEISNMHRNSAVYATAFPEMKTSLEVNCEKDFRVSTSAGEEFKKHTSSSLGYNNENVVVNVDGNYCADGGEIDLTASNNSLIINTDTARKLGKLYNDIDKTLTPREIKEFSFSTTSPSSSTGPKNVNGNNTTSSRTVVALAS